MPRIATIVAAGTVMLGLGLPAAADKPPVPPGAQITAAHPRVPSKDLFGPFRFGTVHLLAFERMVVHVDGYESDSRRPSEQCAILVKFVSETTVLQQGTFPLAPNRAFDTAFHGPRVAGFVTEVHPEISAVGACDMDIVTTVMIQEATAPGSGKTLYLLPGQYSVPLRQRAEDE